MVRDCHTFVFPGGPEAPLYHYCSSASCTLQTVTRRHQQGATCGFAYVHEPFVALHPAYSALCVSAGLDLPSDYDRIKAAFPTDRAYKSRVVGLLRALIGGRTVVALNLQSHKLFSWGLFWETYYFACGLLAQQARQ